MNNITRQSLFAIILLLVSIAAKSEITFYPPFQKAIIPTSSKAIIKYEGIIDYNYLYCQTQDRSHASLIAEWEFNKKQYREKISGGIIFDVSRVAKNGIIAIINESKSDLTLSCEYEFDPPHKSTST